MALETILFVVGGLLLTCMVLKCGYRLGKLRGMQEAQTSSTLRLSVLASGPQSALERLVSTSDPRNQEIRDSGNLNLPTSPYQVMAGTGVAGALETGIKSDLLGDVITTVTEPVYDTATGKFLLIPQGSRILGKYNSRSATGKAGCR